MRNWTSLVACIVVSLTLLQYRVAYTNFGHGRELNVTTWDAFGYYIYLPSTLIYNDATELKWFPAIDSAYNVSGGALYQANKTDNGNYVFKYLGGVAVMQIPSFLVGHTIALCSDYKANGFSPPYQYSLAFGAIFYCILGLFILRGILLRYFSDIATAISIVLLVLATNLIQYISIDSIMSHSYIFFLYVLILYATIKWHEKPSKWWASAIGLIIGVATICRPTEAIMFIIPLLWNTHNKGASKQKWQLVRENQNHLIFVAVFGLIGILPQLIYWKLTAGTFIFNVGSKWVFLNPFFRVLFGWEKGWFIYTPVVILFIVGFFYIKNFPFKKSVIVFSLLNIWVVIAWFDWKYGATYSTRALTQSYPVFALGFTAVIDRILAHKWRLAALPIGIFLIVLNLIQIDQYNSTVLHYNDMNPRYYAKIFMDPNPSPLAMSLLDTDEFLDNDEDYNSELLATGRSLTISCTDDATCAITSKTLDQTQGLWLKIDAEIKATPGVLDGSLSAIFQMEDSLKVNSIRLARPLVQKNELNEYAFYVKVPDSSKPFHFRLAITPTQSEDVVIDSYEIQLLKSK